MWKRYISNMKLKAQRTLSYSVGIQFPKILKPVRNRKSNMTSWFLSWRCCQIFLGSLIMFRHWLKSQIIVTFGFGVTKSFVYMRYTLREKWPCSELFWPVFSLIRAEYGVSISPYSVQMRENADQNYSEYGHILRSDNQKPDFLIEIHWRNFFCRSKVSYQHICNTFLREKITPNLVGLYALICLSSFPIHPFTHVGTRTQRTKIII